MGFADVGTTDADTIINDLQHDFIVFLGQPHHNRSRLGMLEHIGQRLLEYPEDGNPGVFIRFNVMVSAEYAAGQAKATAEILGMALDRCGQTKFLELPCE